MTLFEELANARRNWEVAANRRDTLMREFRAGAHDKDTLMRAERETREAYAEYASLRDAMSVC